MQTITREQVRGILANELLPDPQAEADRLAYEVAGYPDLDALVDAMEYYDERPTFRMWIEEEAVLAELFDAECERRGLAPLWSKRTKRLGCAGRGGFASYEDDAGRANGGGWKRQIATAPKPTSLSGQPCSVQPLHSAVLP